MYNKFIMINLTYVYKIFYKIAQIFISDKSMYYNLITQIFS